MIFGISKNKELTFSPTRYTGRHVPKTDGGRGDETEIKGVKEGPEVFRRYVTIDHHDHRSYDY